MTETLKASLPALLAQLPRAPSAVWPEGEPFVDAIRHGSMSVEVFAPRGQDRQSPHTQDELYIVASGQARFEHNEAMTEARTGDVLFVPAGDTHRFHDMSADFVTWVIFWGPRGGEGSIIHV
ncbi:MAG TPA: cupin domain-containing protein [Acidisoma sp.]|uniref:cupin domain-containing protein n=1 Tax=Acidisoma sp. TaxID=1872115 RepID=UPI002BE42E8C|nr:cupin domain-containing protein [Acidisoma sp.]HTI00278.1 cupin domain-containing protein [Acidisoma sp.]